MSVITLTTDLGHKDYYLAKLKGYLISQQHHVQLIDICHTIDTHDIAKAAYFVKSAYKAFQAGTIHLINVYPEYTGDSRLILCKVDEMYFIAPDNGVLSLIFPDLISDNVKVVKPNHPGETMFQTYAHVCACIHNDLLDECTSPCESFIERLTVQPVMSNHEIRGTIIHIDKMENVVTNISRDIFEKYRQGRDYEIYFKHNDPITSISQTYADVPVGEVLCMFNDSDMLEIAINMGKASTLHGLYLNETIQINFI